MIGTGRYARGLAEAVCAVRAIRTIKVYSRKSENVRRFCAAMEAALKVEVVPPIPLRRSRPPGIPSEIELDAMTAAQSPVAEEDVP